ncbi:hypothetical protein SRB17_23740 [Streptomyces sp. RB17]|nr:hypothetical protein [Streptomyces sp. RB17]
MRRRRALAVTRVAGADLSRDITAQGMRTQPHEPSAMTPSPAAHDDTLVRTPEGRRISRRKLSVRRVPLNGMTRSE